MNFTTLLADLVDSWWEGARWTVGAISRELGASAPDPPAVTPYQVIYAGGKLRLRHYRATGFARSTPVVLVYSLIKRPFVLDLEPGKSVVEKLTSQGFDVFLTDWLPPTSSDSWRGFQAYVSQDLAAGVREVQLRGGVERVTILGYCLGSILGLTYTALHPRDVKNLVSLALPLDTSVRGSSVYSLIDWLDEQWVESLTSLYGNCPAWLLGAFFSLAMPMQRMLGRYMGLEQFNERDRYARAYPAFRSWLDSEVPIAGALFRELTIEVFRKNSLARGNFKIGDKVVDLKGITSPVLNVVADFDIIVDPSSCVPLIEMVGSADRSNLCFPTGHLGIALSDEAHATLWPQIGRWLGEHDN
jgi:polyhydroxyalkanoate synthase subunit PhaC